MEWNFYRGEYSYTKDEGNSQCFTVRAKDCTKSWVVWIESARGFKVSPRRVLAKPITTANVFVCAEEMLFKYIQMYERRLDSM
jgi:hypothetical protein